VYEQKPQTLIGRPLGDVSGKPACDMYGDWDSEQQLREMPLDRGGFAPLRRSISMPGNMVLQARP